MDVPVDPCECDGAASELHNADGDKTESPTALIPPSILELKNGLKEDGTMQFAFPNFSNNRVCVCSLSKIDDPHPPPLMTTDSA